MRASTARTAVRSFAAGVAGLVASYAVAGLTPGFVAASVDRLLARTMPGAVVAFAIETLGSLGQRLNFLVALALAAALLGGAAASAVAVGRRLDRPAVGVGLAAAFAWLAALALGSSLPSALAAGVAVGVVTAAGELRIPAGEAGVSAARRRTLAALASVAGLSTLTLAATDQDSNGSEGGSSVSAATLFSEEERTEIDDLLAEADERSLGVEGLEPLVSQEFYEVDINSVDPDLSADDWQLRFTGAVTNEVTLEFEDLLAADREHRFVTLRCVGESLNGKKLDNALWTGVPIDPFLEEVEPSGCCVVLRAADDYYEEFPLEALRGAFLAFGMNGEPLPRGHGHPVRALVPGHWGEINVKWLTEVEFLEEEIDGYWEKRGWHGTGPVETVAKIHTVEHRDDGSIQVGGHAYAGTRGIERVEVSTDAGDTWHDATLSDPLPGEDVWRQWTYEYDPPGGAHQVVARATDGEGTLQPEAESGAFPSGPTGWVARTVEP